MSESALVVVVGGLLAAVGLGYYLGKQAPVPPLSKSTVSYRRRGGVRAPEAPELMTPPLPTPEQRTRAPRAPSEAEMIYREMEKPPKEYW